MENVKEMLLKAKEEILVLEEKIGNIKDLQNKISEEEKKVKEYESIKEKAIDTAMTEKKKAIDDAYNAYVVKITNKINEAKNKKKEEIKKNKLDRVDAETRALKENAILLNNQISDLLKENKVPQIAGSSFYLTYFKITSIKGFFIALITYIILFFGVPFVISYKFFGKDLFISSNLLKTIAIFIVSFFIFGCIWLLLSNIIKVPDSVFSKLKYLKNDLKNNNKQIKSVTNSIMKDNDESKFDYTDIDREIEQANLDLQKLKEQNDKDINYLNTTVHDQIVQKVEMESKNDIEAITDLYNKDKATLTILNEEIEKLKIEINEKYEKIIGKNNLTSEKIEKLLNVIDTNSAEDLILQKAKELVK